MQALPKRKPENPNARGYHSGDEEESPLDEIIRHFNERWFSAWDATPEEQRVKLIKIVEHVQESAAYQAQVVDNPDEQNRDIALRSLISAESAKKEGSGPLQELRRGCGFPESLRGKHHPDSGALSEKQAGVRDFGDADDNLTSQSENAPKFFT